MPSESATPGELEYRSRRFRLPGGYVDARGEVLRDVELAPLSGTDQAAVGELDGRTPLASVVTALLARVLLRLGTMQRPALEVVRGLLVGDRDFLVFKLYEITIGIAPWVTLRCPHAECAERMDLKVELASLPIVERPVAGLWHTEPGLPRFRLPTGMDQETLGGAGDPERAARLLLERCVGAEHERQPPLDAEAARRLEARIAALSPDLDFELEASCPECERRFAGRLDLVPRLLGELCGSPRDLEHDVHVLAWNYHWAEHEILGLTRRKRRRYVELVERQRDSLGAA